MHSIVIVGDVPKGHAKALSRAKASLHTFRSTSAALKSIPKADALVVDAGLTGVLGLLKKAKTIPKILIFPFSNSGKPKPALLCAPLTYPLFDPSPTELAHTAARAIKEASACRVAEESVKKLRSAMDEITHLEKMSISLMTSKSADEIYASILRRAIKLIGAEGWAYHIWDAEGRKFVSSRYSSDTWKRRMQRAGCRASKSGPRCEPVVFPSGTGRAASKKSGCPFISVPVLVNSSVAGAMEVFRLRGQDGFSEHDTARLVKLAELAAQAVDKIGLQQRLEELVITDDLTKLFNSRYLHRSLETEIQRSSRYSTSVSLIFMDLDHFKDINDHHGHLAGSKLLAEVGQLLVNQLRGLDIVARYGGDEFVIVLPQTELYNAMLIAERIRKDIEQRVFLKEMGLKVSLTASFGVASYPETANSKEDLIRIADESMYDVKRRTRNGVYAII